MSDFTLQELSELGQVASHLSAAGDPRAPRIRSFVADHARQMLEEQNRQSRVPGIFSGGYKLPAEKGVVGRESEIAPGESTGHAALRTILGGLGRDAEMPASMAKSVAPRSAKEEGINILVGPGILPTDRIASGIVTGIPAWAEHLYRSAKRGDLGAITEFAGAMAMPEVGDVTGKAVAKVPEKAARATTLGFSPEGATVSVLNRGLLKKFRLKPAEVANVLPDIKRVNPEVTGISESVSPETNFFDSIRRTKQDVFERYLRMIGRHAEDTTSGDTHIAEPMIKAIPSDVVFEAERGSQQAQAQIKAVREQANLYRGPLNLADLERLRREKTAEQGSFFRKGTRGQYEAQESSLPTAVRNAQATGLRNAIDDILSRQSEEKVPGRELRQKFGTLRKMEEAAEHQQMRRSGRAPLDVGRMISFGGSAADIAGAMASGHPAAALGAIAPIAAGETIHLLNDPDFMIRQAMKRVKPNEYPPEPEAVPRVTESGPPKPNVQQQPYEGPEKFGQGGVPEFKREYGPSVQQPPYESPKGFGQGGVTKREYGQSVQQAPFEKTSSFGGKAETGVEFGNGKETSQKRTTREVQAVPEPRRPVSAVAAGAETIVRVPGSSKSYSGRYEVRELSDVHSSHLGSNFGEDPNFHLKNDRNYRLPVNSAKVVEFSHPDRFSPDFLVNDNPDATNGPPVIDPNGNVLGGNGRTMILQRVYHASGRGAEAYKQRVSEAASRFGIDPGKVRSMKEPVLVRVLNEHPADASAAISEFNVSPTASLTPSERAIVDSRRISPEAMEFIGDAISSGGPDSTLAEALSSRGNEIVNTLIADGVIPQQERAAYVGPNGVTDAGKDRITKLVIGRFFDDPSSIDNCPPLIRQKLARVAAPISAAAVVPGWDLTPFVKESLDLLSEMRSAGLKKPSELEKQTSMFGERKYSPAAEAIAEAIVSKSSLELTKDFRRYANYAHDAETGQSGLYGTVSQEQALMEAIGENK